MSDTFNGYHVWLGIPPSEQPPSHYRLLGISIFESDLDVIDHAADRQMAHVRTFQSGRHGALSQQMLNELAAARLCLLSSDKKTAYDEQLRAKMSGAVKAAPVPVGRAVPVARPVAAGVTPARPATTTPAPPKPPVPKLDEIPLDIEGDAESGTSTLIKVKRRRYKRNSNWQTAAIVGTLAAVVVIGGLVLFQLLQKLDWKQILDEFRGGPMTSTQSAPPPAPAEPLAPAPRS